MLIQADSYTTALRSVVVAEVTKNLLMASDPACLFIDVSTPEGQATGLATDSVVSALLIATIHADRLDQRIGGLSDAMLQRLDAGLKAALGL